MCDEFSSLIVLQRDMTSSPARTFITLDCFLSSLLKIFQLGKLSSMKKVLDHLSRRFRRLENVFHIEILEAFKKSQASAREPIIRGRFSGTCSAKKAGGRSLRRGRLVGADRGGEGERFAGRQVADWQTDWQWQRRSQGEKQHRRGKTEEEKAAREAYHLAVHRTTTLRLPTCTLPCNQTLEAFVGEFLQAADGITAGWNLQCRRRFQQNFSWGLSYWKDDVTGR